MLVCLPCTPVKSIIDQRLTGTPGRWLIGRRFRSEWAPATNYTCDAGWSSDWPAFVIIRAFAGRRDPQVIIPEDLEIDFIIFRLFPKVQS